MSEKQGAKPVALVIDDEQEPMKYYVRELEKSFEIIPGADPDQSLQHVEEQGKNIGIITLDIMMPAGDTYKHSDTKKGLETGVLLYRRLRDLCPDVPIIVLTHVENPDTLQKFPNEPLLQVVQKRDFPPRRLAALALKTFTEREGYSADNRV